MPATFDGDNLRIILPAATASIDVEIDLYSDWKEWMKTGTNSKYPLAFRTFGGDPLSASIEAGAYFMFQNQNGWRIRPAEEDATVTFNGNLAPEDPDLDIVVPTTGGFTVLINGLQPITQGVAGVTSVLNTLAYDGAVHYDSVVGVSGTVVGTHGTKDNPVNNYADWRALVLSTGLDAGDIHQGELELADAFSNFSFRGSGALAELHCKGFSVEGARFEALRLKGGTANSKVAVERCQVVRQTGNPVSFTNFNGLVRNSTLQGTMSVGKPTSNDDLTEFVDCASAEEEGSPPKIIMQTAARLKMTRYTGEVLVTETDTVAWAEVHLSGGRLILDNTNVGGNVRVWGVGEITDNSNGTTVDATELIRPSAMGVAAQDNIGWTSPTFDVNGRMTGWTRHCYDTPANATINDGATGVLESWQMTATYDAGGKQSGYTVVRL